MTRTIRVDAEVREQIRRMAYPDETVNQTLRRIVIGGDVTGPGTPSYSLLTVLLHYAPDADARGRMQVEYNTLVTECGTNLDRLNLVLAGAIVQGLREGDWPWVIQRRNEQAVLQPRPEKGPEGDPALQRPNYRRNVAKHILSAFAGKSVGAVLTVQEILAHRSEEYGDDHPAGGAIVAILFPSQDGNLSRVPGVKGVWVGSPDAEGLAKRGAVKVA